MGTPAVKDWLDQSFREAGAPMASSQAAKGALVTGHNTPQPEDFEKAQVEIVPCRQLAQLYFWPPSSAAHGSVCPRPEWPGSWSGPCAE